MKKLPLGIREEHVERWKIQREILSKHSEFPQWIYMIEWPPYMEEEQKELTPQEKSAYMKNPVLRDTGFVIKVERPVIWAKKEHLYDIIYFLKDHPEFQYTFLLSLTAVDFLGSPDKEDLEKNQGKRFQMVYQFRSLSYKGMVIRVVMPVDEGEKVPSLTKIWVGANWPEREVYDLFGIEFESHPDLRRIIMPDNYRGHPLRKDFPLRGIGEDYLIEDLLKENLWEEIEGKSSS